jgi:hypothetical protein
MGGEKAPPMKFAAPLRKQLSNPVHWFEELHKD